MPDAVVVGGGLAGLVATRRLAEAGADVTVFERADAVGGRVRSRRRDGFVLDRGFQVLFAAYPAVGRELSLDALDLQYFSPGATLARPGERTVLADPFRVPTALPETLFNPDLTLGDKLRVAWLRRELDGRSHDEIGDRGGTSIAAYLERAGFSERFVERFAAPFFGGITLDRSLSTDSVVFEYAFKALAEGGIALPAEGMGAVPEQIRRRAEGAGATVETGTTVTAVEADASGDAATATAGGETVRADAVVVATDPPTAADLTGVDGVPTTGRGCVTLHVAHDSHSGLPTGPRLQLNVEATGPNTVAPASTVAPTYAPDGRTLLSATYLGTPERTDGDLFRETRETLAAWYPEASVDGLELVGVDRVPFAQFAQPPGFRAGSPDVSDPDGPVFLAGDYTRWSSIQGALESGRAAARAAAGAVDV